MPDPSLRRRPLRRPGCGVCMGGGSGGCCCCCCSAAPLLLALSAWPSCWPAPGPCSSDGAGALGVLRSASFAPPLSAPPAPCPCTPCPSCSPSPAPLPRRPSHRRPPALFDRRPWALGCMASRALRLRDSVEAVGGVSAGDNRRGRMLMAGDAAADAPPPAAAVVAVVPGVRGSAVSKGKSSVTREAREAEARPQVPACACACVRVYVRACACVCFKQACAPDPSSPLLTRTEPHPRLCTRSLTWGSKPRGSGRVRGRSHTARSLQLALTLWPLTPAALAAPPGPLERVQRVLILGQDLLGAFMHVYLCVCVTRVHARVCVHVWETRGHTSKHVPRAKISALAKHLHTQACTPHTPANR